MEFQAFSKIPRLSRAMVITEKIDGTNGLIAVNDTMDDFQVGSRSKWITPESDNYGFARWAYANKDELLKLGPGFHYGEWWGAGIQRRYDMKEKVFSLFNTSRWSDPATRPACVSCVPVLYEGPFSTVVAGECLLRLKDEGSLASPGFMQPEGIIVYHVAGGYYFKKTIEKDEAGKGE